MVERKKVCPSCNPDARPVIIFSCLCDWIRWIVDGEVERLSWMGLLIDELMVLLRRKEDAGSGWVSGGIRVLVEGGGESESRLIVTSGKQDDSLNCDRRSRRSGRYFFFMECE